MNLSNLTVEDVSCPDKLSIAIINAYIMPAISVLGVILNLMSVIVLFQISKRKSAYSNMLYYLLFKSINDGLQFLINVFTPFYFCIHCENSHSYIIIIWYIYFFYYAEDVLMLCSSLMELMATFDCCIHIVEKMKFCYSKKIPFIIAPFIQVFATIYYVPLLFEFKIEQLISFEHSVKIQSYTYVLTDFYYSKAGKLFRIGHVVIRDIIPFMLLILLNFFIILKFRTEVKRKLKLNHNMKQTKSVQAAINADKKNRIMILLSGLNFMIGHFGLILYYIQPFQASPQFWSCFVEFYYLPFYLSFVVNVFLYYVFNKNFRNQFCNNLRFLFNQKPKNNNSSVISNLTR